MQALKRALFPTLLIVAAAAYAVLASGLFPSSASAQPGVMIYSETYDAADTEDGAGLTNVIAAPGAVLGDFCVASVSVDVQDVTLTCNIQAAGLAEVRMQNESTASRDLGSATWRVMVFPHGTR